MPSRTSRSVALLTLALFAAACTRTTLQGSAAQEHGGEDDFARMDFWDAISTDRAVSNTDAVHALSLHYGLPAPGDDATRLKMARDRGWMPEKASWEGNTTARVGFVARAICVESGIRGGLTMRLVGTRERYAVNELNYRGWLPGMSPEQALSGLQLIALLSKAEDAASGGPDVPREKFQ
ncbi:MAG: hypothetical protein HC813_00940 [Planctomycetes bacterium]|nr:hypothetical protein [Planctomycetota bacterium]